MGTKLCRYCKTVIPKKAIFCTKCGKKQGGIGKWIKTAAIWCIVICIVAGFFGEDDEKDIETIDKNSEIIEKVSEDFCFEQSVASKSLKPKISLVEMLANIDDTFAVTLLKLIDHKKMSEVKCYKMANVSKQTWYKIMNERDYSPSKNTVIAFAIALKLTLEETRRLLATVGFTLSKSSKFDIIIEYFLTIGEYDIFKINQTLFEFDQVCLGV
mgnify:CR=1 FL=1